MRFKYDVLEWVLPKAKEMTVLEIQFLKAEELPLLAQFTNLKYLYVYFTETQPSVIELMPNLQRLEFGMWCLDTIDFSTANNPLLEILCIHETTTEIKQCNLDLQNNGLLKELVLTDLHLQQLPPGCNKLNHLVEAELYGNQLTGLPLSLPPTLKRLDIRDVVLTEVELAHIQQSIPKNCVLIR